MKLLTPEQIVQTRAAFSSLIARRQIGQQLGAVTKPDIEVAIQVIDEILGGLDTAGSRAHIEAHYQLMIRDLPDIARTELTLLQKATLFQCVINARKVPGEDMP